MLRNQLAQNLVLDHSLIEPQLSRQNPHDMGLPRRHYDDSLEDLRGGNFVESDCGSTASSSKPKRSLPSIPLDFSRQQQKAFEILAANTSTCQEGQLQQQPISYPPRMVEGRAEPVVTEKPRRQLPQVPSSNLYREHFEYPEEFSLGRGHTNFDIEADEIYRYETERRQQQLQNQGPTAAGADSGCASLDPNINMLGSPQPHTSAPSPSHNKWQRRQLSESHDSGDGVQPQSNFLWFGIDKDNNASKCKSPTFSSSSNNNNSLPAVKLGRETVSTSPSIKAHHSKTPTQRNRQHSSNIPNSR